MLRRADWMGDFLWGLLLLGLSAAMLAVVACGGESKSSGSLLSPADDNKWDVSRADELAHLALIQASDLPGSGWDVSDDDFSDSEFPATAACDAMTAFRTESRRGLAGRANRYFSREEAGRSTPTGVNAEVQVYGSAGDLATLFKKEQGLQKDGTMATCLKAYMLDIFETSFTNATVDTKVALLGKAPSGAIAYGFELTLGDSDDSQPIHAEYYVWLQSNALLQVNVSGPRDLLTTSLINTAIQKSDDAARRAAEGKAAATPPQETTKPGAKVSLLAELKSYRYEVRIEASGTGGPVESFATPLQDLPGGPTSSPYVLTVSGALVPPDKAIRNMKAGDFELQQVVVGDDEWSVYEGNVEGPYPTTIKTRDDLSMAETVWSPDIAQSISNALICADKAEAMNGVRSKKCTIDQASLKGTGGFGTFFGKADMGTVKSYDVQVWLAQPGDYPARVVMTVTGEDTRHRAYEINIQMNLTDANKTIAITPPVTP